MADLLDTNRRKKVQKGETSSHPVVFEIEDRLSHMPEEILKSILSFLPMEDVLRTSSLSKMWRKLWYSFHRLIFDFDEFPEMEDEDTYENFEKFIDDTLACHSSSDVETLKIILWPRNECEMPLKNEWVDFALQHNVQHLYLNGSIGQLQRLPSSLFACGSLVKLELVVQGLVIVWPLFLLPKLRTLVLKYALLSECTEQDLSLNCPELTRLSLAVCDVSNLNVLRLSASKLITLSIFNCEGMRNCLLQLHTPSLNQLLYLDDVPRQYLSNAPSLTAATVAYPPLPTGRSRDDISQAVAVHFGQFCHVEYLCLGHWVLEYLSSAQDLLGKFQSISFEYLEKMELLLCPSQQQVHTATLFLSSCPNLRTLLVGFVRPEEWNPGMLDMTLEKSSLAREGILGNLRFVEVEDIEWSKCELDMVEFLLGNALSLVELRIVESENVVINWFNGFISGFRRASPEVQISFH